MSLKTIKSILDQKNELFRPLPEEQQLTEASLLKLERQIAKSVKKNEKMLEKSISIASQTVLD